MTTIFIVGGVWFYTLLLIAAVLVIWALEYDYYWRATLVIVGTFLALNFFGSSNELRALGSYIWHNPVVSFGFFLSYLGIGTVWAIISWKRFLGRTRREYLEKKRKMSTHEAENIVRDNKHRIITWMAYWPFSILWSALRDPFQEIYERLSGTFSKMAMRDLSEIVEKKE